MTGENCRQFWLLTWTSFIGQFVYPVGEEGMGVKGMDGVIVILASNKFKFIRVHEDPCSSKSIFGFTPNIHESDSFN